MIAAYRADDATRFDLADMAHVQIIADWILLYFVEHDLPTPRSLIEAAWKSQVGGNLSHVVNEVAEALASGDTIRLAAAVDTAEAHHLVVHAARMRIVLAQRTGDRAPLERARPVLERLGDRQFLRRLEEVRAVLQ
jgi:hypothetical protein